ncbi:histone-lysine N-methyltransferase, H3 lysine-9 specific SUVH4-like [Canna indica]|uniref:Histone-lysine N-methyltransferase, H3 lysine-9 specific SUVH4-like n=1 Tax=Canna indica TaxID=4628 RepID=A0AAQ3QC04_9LILI|nr:histone-lysine N-methyltransferase, H3 lysine-9 specific SUVH4-like [Canna indica]
MSEVVEIRRLPCVRDFPKGCGPGAMVADQKPKEELPPPAAESQQIAVRDFPKGSSPQAMVVDQKPKEELPPPASESQQIAASNRVVESPAGSAAKLPSSEVEGKILVSIQNEEHVECAAPVGCLEPPVMDSPLMVSGNMAAAEANRDGEADQGMRDPSKSKQDDKLTPQQLLSNGLEQPKASYVSGPDGSSSADGIQKRKCVSKMYPPPRKATVMAVRNFPIGCGPSAPRMTREQALKVVADASSEGKSLIEDKQPTEDQQLTAGKDLADAKIPAGNETAKRMEERIELRNIEDETVKEQVRETKLSDPLPPPNIKISEEENDQLMVKETVSEENRDNRILVMATPDKSLNEQAIEPLSNNLEAQMCKTPGPSKLADKRLSSGKSTDKLVKSGNVSKSVKRKFSCAIADEGALIERKNYAENSEACGQRLIILALMASPHCPWRQGRKSGTPGSRSALTPKSKVRREGTISCRQPALPKLKREPTISDTQLALDKPKDGTASDMQLDLDELKGEDTTLDMQFGSEEVKDESFASHYEENEGAITLYQGSSEPCIAVPPLSVYDGSGKMCVNVPPLGPSGWDYSGSSRQDIAARLEVRRVLRLFQVICRKLLQGEEAKSNGSGNIKRVDLNAAQILKRKGEWVNSNKQFIGIVPGVEVGDEFQYRVELSIIGLHRPFQGGIDAVKKDGISVASSIVASGGYKDDMDSSDVLIYSGSGGNRAGANKPPEDQKLERGNLALKNSIDAKTPVRVIHGIKEMKGGSSHDTKPKLVSTFTYAGLYLVEKYWQEKGPHGFNVFKFQLRRMPGQPELALSEVKRSKRSKVREGLCVKDISDGKEKIPICVINTINDECPPPFKYITKMKYPSWHTKTPPKGCDCKNGCSESGNCACAVKNGGEIPFNFNGAIVQAKPLVYECGPSCKCPPSCHNRVSQRGIQIPLEIFRTNKMGWGVRSLYSIPSGSFICEYVGELLKDTEADKRSNDEYLFDIGHNYDDHSLWEGLPSLIPELNTSSQCDTVDDVGFTIDAAEYGNVGRFINHSCSPNLYAQNVLYDHDDRRIPHIMLFAAENIPPLQELTYHYNYTIDEVHDAEGNIKKKDCYCGSPECTGRLY